MRALPALAALLLWSAPAAAQHWSTPSFQSPRRADDLGVYLIRPTEPFDGWGVAGIWRQTGNIDLGVRGGLLAADNEFDDDTELIWILGAEASGPLALFGRGSPLLAAWSLGVGGAFNSGSIIDVPVGVSIGAQLGSPGFLIIPYVQPRASFFLSDDEFGEGDEGVDLILDVGADFVVGENLIVRAGASFGGEDVGALGIGIAWRLARGVAVR